MKRWAQYSLVVVALTLAGCWSPGDHRRPLAVYAASSLSDGFHALAQAFERKHPDVVVRLSVAGSQVLRYQIEQGAPAQIFASADRLHAQALAEAGLLQDLRAFASNRVVLLVGPDSDHIQDFADLAQAQRLVMGTDSVPIGRYSRALLDRAGQLESVLGRVVSFAPNVRLLRAKVQLGEADAALVYQSDAQGMAQLRVVPVPTHLDRPTELVMGRIGDASPLTTAWLNFVASDAAQTMLQRHGFGRPP